MENQHHTLPSCVCNSRRHTTNMAKAGGYCCYLRECVRRLLPYHHSHSLDLLRTGLCITVLLLSLATDSTSAQSMKYLPETPKFTSIDTNTFRGQSNGLDIQYYRYLHIDTVSNTLLVGAMNFFFQLQLNDISTNHRMSRNITNSMIENVNYKMCSRLQKSKDFECQNHIRSIIRQKNGKFQVCGTAAFYPMIFEFDTRDISGDFIATGSRENGKELCSRDPADTCTAIYITEGNPGNESVMYSGAIRDIPKSDAPIYRPNIAGHSELLRTDPKKEWLYKPEFVASFDVGDYVFFFLRETAMEHMTCGERTYSRVARVCKSDRGGSPRVLENRWTTFFKARLTCSLPGNVPFYFDEIHDVIQTSDGNFHGVFTTSEHSMHGSAVCSFTLEAIGKAFDGPFLQQLSENSKWVPVPESDVPSPRPGKCTPDSTSLPESTLRFTEQNPLMANSVTAHTGAPLYSQQGVTFTKVAVTTINKYTVYYLVERDSGTIHKVASWKDSEGEQKSKTVAIWEGLTNGEPVWQMKLDGSSLYLSTDRDVIQTSISHCRDYSLCTQCVQDPHCGWDQSWSICTKEIGRFDVVQDVESDHPESVCGEACKHVNRHQHYIHVQGDAIHFNCSSRCAPTDAISWYHDNREVAIDNRKYFLSADNGLIVFDVQRDNEGRYECRSRDVALVRHELTVNNCNDAETCWRQEFSKWCQEFDEYKKELTHWKCLKNQCVGNNECIPNGVSDQCPLS